MRAEISGLDTVLSSIDSLNASNSRAALADALNHTANQARIALRSQIESVFDRPTPFTLNAIRVIPARGTRLDAAVFVKDEKDGATKAAAPEDWFLPQVEGGSRAVKRSEQMLRRVGVLPAGMFIVPAAGARLDRYGNISRGHMQQLLSGLRAAEYASGYSANATNSRRSRAKGHAQAFFVMRDGAGRPIGIAERRGRSVALVLAFVRQPHYVQRLDFYGVVSKVADENLSANIDKAIAKALS